MTQPATTFDPCEPEQIPAEVIERRDRDERIVGWFENAFHILNAYQAHQTSAKQLRISRDCMEMALGFRLAAGAEGPAELARKYGVSKQAVGKCLNHFIAQLRLEPLPFQRKADARENMRKARKSQVKK